MEKPPKIEEGGEENLAALSAEKKALRRAVKEVPAVLKDVPEQELAATRVKTEGLIAREGGISAVKARLGKERGMQEVVRKTGIDEAAIAESLGARAADYRKIFKLEEDLAAVRDYEMRLQMQVRNDPVAEKAHQSIIDATRAKKLALEEALNAAQETQPQIVRAAELIEYKKGLQKEGHLAAVPSVEKNLERIGRNMLSGKPMFLHGPTGTGKTSLARYAAEHFTGKPAEMVYCSPQTRESAIWGKTGIKPTEGGGIQTVDIYGPLVKAMLEGKGVIFDEFTALPKEQMVFIKGIFNAKPGDTVNVMGNGQIKIAHGFQMIFTANLKSEKNPERQDLPPEIAREFEQNNIKIDYPEKSEAYDIMLARLLESDGSIKMSWHDLNETLPKFAEAIAEIDLAYTGAASSETARLIGTADASGKAPGLKKLVFTQGTIEAILEDLKIGKQLGDKLSFVEHLDRRLKIGLTFEEYPLADRILAAKILASKGFLRTLTSQELGLPADTFNFDAMRKLRGGKDDLAKLIAESGNEKDISILELAGLDPFNLRGKVVQERGAELLGKLEKERGVAEELLDFIEARELIGEQNFYGPKEIEKAFGFTPENVPPIHFTREELISAERLGMLLIYYPETDANGAPLTVESITKLTPNNTAQNGEKLLYKDQFADDMTIKSRVWFRGDSLVLNAKLASGWQLVTPEVLDNTTGKNYLAQTTVLAEKYEATFKDSLPSNWDELKKDFAGLENSTVGELGEHELSEILREPFTNTIFRYLLVEKLTGKKILSTKYTWSNAVSSGGALVVFGWAAADGADVSRLVPGGDWDDDGAVFFRR